MNKAIKELQSTALTSARRAVDAADRFAQQVPSKLKASASLREVQPILAKTEAFKSASEARMRGWKVDHLNAIAKTRAETSKFLRSERHKHKGPFTELRTKLGSLGKEVRAFRSVYSEISKGRNDIFAKCKTERSNILSQARAMHNTHKQKLSQLKDQRKQGMKNHAADLADLKQQLTVHKRSHKAELDALSQAIQREEKHEKESSDSHSATMKKRTLDGGSYDAEMTRQWKMEVQRRMNFQRDMVKHVTDCQTDSARLIGAMKHEIGLSLGQLRGALVLLKNRSEQQIADNRARLENQKSEFVKRGKERLGVLQSAVDAHLAADHRAEADQKASIGKLKQSMRGLEKAHATDLTKQQAKFATDRDKMTKANDAKCESRRKELRALFDRGAAEKAKRLDDMGSNFQTDLTQKAASLDAERAKTIAGLEGVDPRFSEKAEEAHQLALAQAHGRLDFLIRRLVILREEHGKKCAALQAEVMRIEKAQREFERRKKTETIAIDQNYEMEIQIEQVKVSNSMDNIAKLYDAEENQRGCEIVEVIRKVRQTHNGLGDLLMRKQRELAAAGMETLRTDLMNKIATLRAHTRESNLQAAILAVEEKRNASTAHIEAVVGAKISATRDEINQYRKTHQQTLEALQAAILSDNEQFKSHAAQVQAEKAQIAQQVQDEMAPVDAEFDRVKDKLDKEHFAAVASIQKRIEAAARQRDEIGQKCASDQAAERAEGRVDLTKRAETNGNLNAQTFAAAALQNDELSDRITDMSKAANDAEFRFSQLPSRRGDRKGIENLRTKIQSLDELIQRSFDAFYGLVRDAPMIVRERELVSSPASARSGRNTNALGSKNSRTSSRRESTRVLTPVESSNLKKRTYVSLAQSHRDVLV
jgi:hypothetical protein